MKFRLYYSPAIDGYSTEYVDMMDLEHWSKDSFVNQLDAYCQAMAHKGVMPNIVQMNQMFTVQREYFLFSTQEVTL